MDERRTVLKKTLVNPRIIINNRMNEIECCRIIESLREGIPPEEYVSLLTVGRLEEIERLNHILSKAGKKAYFVKANWGCGKTHLLKFIKEEALRKGYVTSLITLDSKSNARFNRMDQIFGQICRNIQIPGSQQRSIRYLLDAFCGNKSKYTLDWDMGKPDFLESHSIFFVLRAWAASYIQNHEGRNDDQIEDWLFNPFNYYTRKDTLRTIFFEEPYPIFPFYAYQPSNFNNIRKRVGHRGTTLFNLPSGEYINCWASICDIAAISKMAGYKGLVILFDEFEQGIYDLKRSNFQMQAIRNLSEFFSNKYSIDLTFFALTPPSIEVFKTIFNEILYNSRSFTNKDIFEISLLSETELIELSRIIVSIYEKAYKIEVNDMMYNKLKEVCKATPKIDIANRIRETIKKIVGVLDEEYQ